MPIFEYRCDACKKEFEVLILGMNDKGKAVCPKCNSRKTRKLMSSFGRGKYTSLLKGGSGSYDSAGTSSSSGCGSCSSSNCSSCGH